MQVLVNLITVKLSLLIKAIIEIMESISIRGSSPSVYPADGSDASRHAAWIHSVSTLGRDKGRVVKLPALQNGWLPGRIFFHLITCPLWKVMNSQAFGEMEPVCSLLFLPAPAILYLVCQGWLTACVLFLAQQREQHGKVPHWVLTASGSILGQIFYTPAGPVLQWLFIHSLTSY